MSTFLLLLRDSDYGNEDVAESIKEEKKRKQMEAIADDLFNNEKVWIAFFSLFLEETS